MQRNINELSETMNNMQISKSKTSRDQHDVTAARDQSKQQQQQLNEPIKDLELASNIQQRVPLLSFRLNGRLPRLDHHYSACDVTQLSNDVTLKPRDFNEVTKTITKPRDLSEHSRGQRSHFSVVKAFSFAQSSTNEKVKPQLRRYINYRK